MAETSVVRLRGRDYDRALREGRAVFVARPSHWGNPFRVRPGRDRLQAVHLYWRWLAGDPTLAHIEPRRRAWILANVHRLRGQALGCWCAPELCHGDILALLAEGELEVRDD